MSFHFCSISLSIYIMRTTGKSLLSQASFSQTYRCYPMWNIPPKYNHKAHFLHYFIDKHSFFLFFLFFQKKSFTFVFGLLYINYLHYAKAILAWYVMNSSRRAKHEEVVQAFPCKADLGGTIVQDILKAFTWRSVHDYLKLRNFHYILSRT